MQPQDDCICPGKNRGVIQRSFLPKPFIKHFRELTNDTLTRLSE